MNQAQLAAGSDRLPWLEDEPPAPVARSRGELLPWVIVALLLVAIASYWIVAPQWGPPDTGSVPRQSGTTSPLPQARSPAPQPQVKPTPAPEVEPVTQPTVALPRSARPPHRTARTERRRALSPMETSGADLTKTIAEQEGATAPAKQQPAPATAAAPPAAATPPVAKSTPLRLWPSRQANGAYGRLVQIGAFGTRQQAKLGWRRMKRAYPAVGRLPAVVVAARNSRGRLFYRFQIGTTSQAHSEVLCQRMERIRFSCAVVGLPWKRKVER